MRKVRGDDKLFASESRKYSVPVSGRGPVAVAARTGKQVTITDTSSMVRAELAQEFGIRKIFFVPIEAGVLEYGTPSGEEVVLLKLMSLTISEMSHPGSMGRFFKLLGELFLCLRLLITIEENNLVSGVRKTVSSFLTSVISLDQKIKKGETKREGSIFSRVAVFGVRAIMTVMGPIVWTLSYLVDAHKRRKRARLERADPLAQDNYEWESAVSAFKQADIDGNGVLSFDEFEAAFGSVLKQTKVASSWREFEAMDKDGDGSISLAEFTAELTPYKTGRMGSTGRLGSMPGRLGSMKW